MGNFLHHTRYYDVQQSCVPTPSDTLYDTEASKEFYSHGQYGYDRFNRRVLYEHSGAVDGKAIDNIDNCINYHWSSIL